ncbi:hypothetical protein LMH87_006081 [Akanthomyces muscarius]|uniref:Zn(2)-C6 fungal-type domain-containing protein n=1 Tax=Akanthomyces muscarius TaxID=2231603 RepID=A0A9W8QNV4_AKAMU|nr:hypothetical protein LMH87_006081 [Akanthomyces muscarius]KAJ4164405.1 hypothetical protein LMH87_006081 [Akanthomyces muscarius]
MKDLSLESAKPSTPNPVKRRRRGGPRNKTGDDTCKARHTRCDEGKPCTTHMQTGHGKLRPMLRLLPATNKHTS